MSVQPDAAVSQCPECGGSGFIRVLLRTTRSVGGIKCHDCGGTGTRVRCKQWEEDGQKFKEARILREETLRDFSRRTGVSVLDASKAERGIINPSILKEKQAT